MSKSNKSVKRKSKCSKCKLCKYDKHCKRYRKCAKNRCSNKNKRLYSRKSKKSRKSSKKKSRKSSKKKSRKSSKKKSRKSSKKKSRKSSKKNSHKSSKKKSLYLSKHSRTSKECKIGSRAKVYHGICEKTSGGLRKNDLMYNSIGKLVSKKASKSAGKVKNLGNFLSVVSTNTFTKSPKVGTIAYNNIMNN
jgi:hypothetical protein